MTGAELRAWRKEQRLSRPLLGAALDRTPRTLSAYEAHELPVPRYIELACMMLGYPGTYRNPGVGEK